MKHTDLAGVNCQLRSADPGPGVIAQHRPRSAAAWAGLALSSAGYLCMMCVVLFVLAGVMLVTSAYAVVYLSGLNIFRLLTRRRGPTAD